MSKSTLISRSILVLACLILFALAAIYLYNKQRVHLNYLSFELENSNGSIIVPDIDRLVDKFSTVDDFEMQGWPTDLASALNAAFQHKGFSFNRELAKECYITFNDKDYAIVFNTTSSVNSIVEVINAEFGAECSLEGKTVNLNGVVLRAEHFGNFLCFSSNIMSPVGTSEELEYGNADYVEFNEDHKSGIRHILSKKFHFRLWETQVTSLLGRPVAHAEYFGAAPTKFDQLVFYGSSRITEDVNQLFNAPDFESFDWLNDGLIYVQKDSFELIIAVQGESRDLDLMLEEQTIEQNDSASISYFNVGKFKVMPFKTHFNWTSSINELNSELRYYTEYNNFNVMANSIPAMRWYLGEVQLGNLLGNNQQVASIYQECLPEVSHYVLFEQQADGGYRCKSKVYGKDSTCLITEVMSNEQVVQMEGVEVMTDFNVNIVPSRLQAVHEKGKTYILLNNLNQLSLYANDGEKIWSLNLSTPLVDKPQIIDFENDGLFEYVLFQQDQVDVVNNKGKSLNGYPIKLGGVSTAGLAVNYDNEYKWRIIVNVGNTVKLYSEEGKIVEGWQFGGMQAAMKGKIYHVLTDGKDIITFKDRSDRQYVLNRRGELRIQNPVVFSLPNETDFITGSMESSLRKMGYKNGYIYNYYILDGQRDSVKLDQPVTAVRTFWEYNSGKPLLIIEEPGRLLIVNEFGYIMSEVLKPDQSNNEFVGLVGSKDYGFVFADNSQNSIYLLNNFGKMILPSAVEGSAVSIIDGNLLYSFSGINLKAYKIAN
ncbi:MAG: hypothetical protein H6582_13140 [Crocinitomicaceae bacterium]|nr:hypothetical protein [Crocinitomicaceae bacterium]